MVENRGKRSKLAGREEGKDTDHVDEQLAVQIEKLQAVQEELEKINEEASDQVLEIEQKYSEIRRPVYNKRERIIQSILDFWSTAILSHPVLGDLMTENDGKILKYLVSLDVEEFKDLKSGYAITFSFLPNPYFENEKLTKTTIFSDEATASVTGTAIKWKEGMGIANGSAHKTEGTKRPFEEDSFFNWFNEAEQKTFLDGLGDEVAEMIKEDLWPNPLKYFNNEVDEEDLVGEDDDEEGTEDDGDDDDDDDDDDEQNDDNGQDDDAKDDRS